MCIDKWSSHAHSEKKKGKHIIIIHTIHTSLSFQRLLLVSRLYYVHTWILSWKKLNSLAPHELTSTLVYFWAISGTILTYAAILCHKKLDRHFQCKLFSYNTHITVGRCIQMPGLRGRKRELQIAFDVISRRGYLTSEPKLIWS